MNHDHPPTEAQLVDMQRSPSCQTGLHDRCSGVTITGGPARTCGCYCHPHDPEPDQENAA